MSERIIFALIGVLVGGIAGGFFARHFFGKDYEKRIKELEQENKQLMARERKEKAREMFYEEAELDHEDAKVTTSIITQLTEAKKEREKAEQMVKDHGYSDEDEDDYDEDDDLDFDDPFAEEDEVIVKPEEPQKSTFTKMTQEEYEEDFEYRDSESLTYYQKDHVLADALDDRVGNPETVIGEEALIEADSTEQNYIYVLEESGDNMHDKMYEIEINHEDSYYRDILRGGV